MLINIKFPDFKEKVVTLSYDDGVRQDKKLVSIMKKNGLRGTFNLNGGLFSESYEPQAKVGRMSKKEAAELYVPSGMEIAVHGYMHLPLTRLNSAFIINEILDDRKELEQISGVVKGMAYAYGLYDDDVIDVLKKCGINYSRTVISTEGFDLPSDWLKLPATCHHNNPKLMDLARKFVEKEKNALWYKPKMFYLWGHSYEFDNNDNWNVIEEFAEFIGKRRDVWYATNGEIYEYVQAYNNLQFSADMTTVFNPSHQSVCIDVSGKSVLIPPGRTIKF